MQAARTQRVPPTQNMSPAQSAGSVTAVRGRPPQSNQLGPAERAAPGKVPAASAYATAGATAPGAARSPRTSCSVPTSQPAAVSKRAAQVCAGIEAPKWVALAKVCL